MGGRRQAQEHSLSGAFIGGGGRGIPAGGGERASRPVVWPRADDFVELITWRQGLLHVPVPFDLVVGGQSFPSHSTSY